MIASPSRVVWVLMLIGTFLLSACAPVAPSAPASETAEAVLARAMTSEPAQIDPQGAPSSGLSLVLPYLFDTLVVRDVDNTLLPGLAESWSVSDDGLAITLTLRPGVVFQDGTPLVQYSGNNHTDKALPP